MDAETSRSTCVSPKPVVGVVDFVGGMLGGALAVLVGGYVMLGLGGVANVIGGFAAAALGVYSIQLRCRCRSKAQIGDVETWNRAVRDATHSD